MSTCSLSAHIFSTEGLVANVVLIRIGVTRLVTVKAWLSVRKIDNLNLNGNSVDTESRNYFRWPSRKPAKTPSQRPSLKILAGQTIVERISLILGYPISFFVKRLKRPAKNRSNATNLTKLHERDDDIISCVQPIVLLVYDIIGSIPNGWIKNSEILTHFSKTSFILLDDRIIGLED